MKIIFFQNNSDLYGSSRSLLRLTRRLALEGHRVAVVLPYSGPLEGRLREQGVDVHIQKGLAVVDGRIFKSPLKLLAFVAAKMPCSLIRVVQFLRRWKPDLVHTNTSVILTPGPAACWCGIPHVWHIRENYSEFRPFWRLYQYFMAAFSRQIVCVSRSIQDQFTPSLQRHKTRVIHNGLPREEFADVSPARVRAFRDHYGLGDAPLAGLIGRINIARKGHRVLVEAVRRLGQRFPEARYLFIGSAFPGNEAQQQQLETHMHEAGVRERFVFTGDVDDIKAAYAALDIVLMISELPEAFSGVVLEGMAMGKAVIATDSGGTAEQLVHGRTGILIPPGDPDALADALGKLWQDEDLRHAYGGAGRRHFLQHFEFDNCYKQMADVYAELSAEHSVCGRKK